MYTQFSETSNYHIKLAYTPCSHHIPLYPHNNVLLVKLSTAICSTENLLHLGRLGGVLLIVHSGNSLLEGPRGS